MALQGVLGVLGFGNMGSAILGGLIETGTIAAPSTLVYDLAEPRCQAARAMGAQVAPSPAALAVHSDTLMLAVKPQQIADALVGIQDGLDPHTLIVSIMAGISTRFLRGHLGKEFRVVRVMPNTPALVNAGAAAIALSENCTETDAETASTIFSAVGIVETMPEEALDAVTALSGSGPAYFFYMAECLAEAAVQQGLAPEQAARLAGQTLYGAGKLLAESGEPASVLRERVTSKGGTTAAALARLRALDFQGIVSAAVEAAANRSRELGK